MVEFPSYIRVVPGNATRRVSTSSNKTAAARDSGKIGADGPAIADGLPNTRPAEVVELISRENQAADASRVPTASEAAKTLRRLQEDLPGLGQAVGELHSKLDRHRVIDLLTPLVEN